MKSFSYLTRGALLAGVLLLSLQAASAQKRYSISPSRTVTKQVEFGSMTDAYITVRNESLSDLNLNWRPIKNELPADWDYSLCDNQNCYPGIPSDEPSYPFSPIPPGMTGDMKLTVDLTTTPATGSKYGTAVLAIFEEGSTEEDTLEFFITTEGLSVVDQELSAQVSLLPNPASDFTNVQMPAGIVTIRVYDAFGAKIAEYAANGEFMRISTADFAAGTYFVVGQTGAGRMFARKFQKN